MHHRCQFFSGDLQSPLHLATYLNLAHVVKDLVEKGASLELQDQDGNTALHVACQHGQTECTTEMTREFSPSKLAPVLETQNWRGEGKKNSRRASSVDNPLLFRRRSCFCIICLFVCLSALKASFVYN